MTKPAAVIPLHTDHGRPFPRSAQARELVMKGVRAQQVRKLLDRPAEAVPSEGTPSSPELATGGSILPSVAASRVIPQTAQVWTGLTQAGEIMSPPYDPWYLVCAIEESDLGPSIEAMAANIGGFGLELEPTFPTRDEETGEPLEPPPGAAEEEDRLRLFFASCNVEHGGWTPVQFMIDWDTEGLGDGYMELLRDRLGAVAAVEHAPSYEIRLGSLSGQILVDWPFRNPTTGELVTLQRHRRFRTFVQLKDGKIRYFKQFGDPRHLNHKTGRYRAAEDGPWEPEQGSDTNATELVHFRIYTPRSDYGIPRWIGALPWSRNGRLVGEVLNAWFKRNPWVKLLITAGGTFKKDSLKQAVKEIRAASASPDKKFGLATVEAELEGPDDPLDQTRGTNARLAVADLDFQIPPELYSGPDSLAGQAAKRVRAAFRLPGVYYGAAEDHTRASANTARATAEEQVFVPIRFMRWESWLNGQLLPSMGVNYWRATLRGAQTTDDNESAEAAAAFIPGGGATPNALIGLLNKTSGEDHELITEPWGDRPFELTMKLVDKGLDPNKPLAELAGELAEREAQAKEQAAAQLEALNQGKPPADDDDDDDDDKQLQEKAAKSLLLLGDLRELVVAVKHLGDAGELEPDPTWYG
jgi:capsid portal protein